MFSLSIINVSAFVASLPTLLIGMIGIFIVIAVIVLCMVVLEKVFSEQKKPRKKKKEKDADTSGEAQA